MTRAVETFRLVLDAVADLDARVLLTVGRAVDPAALGPPPRGVHVEQWVNQDDVLAEAELVVGHGGSGTTLGALAAGLPLVVVPQFADQFVNAKRVIAAGAGLAVEPALGDDGRRLSLQPHDAARIRAAIETVRGTPSFRDAARRIGNEMAKASTVDEVIPRLALR